jgi:DNA modification methylase
VLKKQKQKIVECWVPDRELSEEEVEELMIRHNQNTGSFDYEILANEYEMFDLLQWGFTEEQLIGCFEDKEKENALDEESDEPIEPPKDEDSITKLGDLYELGNHRLICGDSTIKETVDKVLNGEKPILMVTDPPYGVNYDPSKKKIADGNKGRSVKSFGKVQNDNRKSWKEAYKLFNGEVAYIWHADKQAKDLLLDIDEIGFILIYQIIWVKQLGFSMGDYHHYHEPCYVAVKKGCKHNWQGSRKERTVWEIQSRAACGDVSKMEEFTGHGTQKPLECMAKPIRNNSGEGEGVYDPFLGSGTTLIAAENLKRKCYGIEISSAYCDVTVKRWINYRKNNGLSFDVICNGEKTTAFE